MVEENKNENKDEQVTLEAAQYNALLDRIDELEEVGSKVKDKGQNKNYENYDDLVDGGRGQEQQKGQIVLNEMDNEQLLGFMETQLGDNVINPMAVAIEGLRLDMEFMRVGGRKGFEDIEEVRDDVLKVIQENPNMGVEKAYKLVRIDKPKEDKGEDKVKVESVTARLNLPGRVGGEKPGTPSSSTQVKPAETIREAASEALDEAGITD